jgi:hypothetical protein
MGGICSMNGRKERCLQGFGGRNIRERDQLEDQDVDRRMIFRWYFRKWDGGMDWINLAQDRDRC